MDNKTIIIIIDCLGDKNDLYKNELFKKYNTDKIDLKIFDDLFDGFYSIATKNIPIVIMDIDSLSHEFEKGLYCYKLISELFPKTVIIIYTHIDFHNVNTKAKKLKIELNKNNYFYKDPSKGKFIILKDKVEQEIDYLFSKKIRIDDQWILKKLNDENIFKYLGIENVKPLDTRIINAFEDHENNEYSIWFSKDIYNSIFDDRILPILKIAGLDIIADTLKYFLDFERMLYITPFDSNSKRYRDHFLHQLRVAILGDFLLDITINNSGEKLIDKITGLLNNRNDPHSFEYTFDTDNVRKTWWITALMHDCSYPLYSIFEPQLYQEKNYNKLLKIYTNELFEQFKINHDETMNNFIKDSESRLLEMNRKIELNSNLSDAICNAAKFKKLHSIYSAYNFWNKCSSSNNNNFCKEIVVQSIILHHEFYDNENDEPSITIYEYPIAFLLILIDEIQEWGRPIIIKDKANDPTKISKVIELNEISIEGIIEKPIGSGNYFVDGTDITFSFNYKKLLSDYSDEPIKFDPDKKYISKRKNLRRLKSKEILPQIIFELEFNNITPKSIKI